MIWTPINIPLFYSLKFLTVNFVIYIKVNIQSFDGWACLSLPYPKFDSVSEVVASGANKSDKLRLTSCLHECHHQFEARNRATNQISKADWVQLFTWIYRSLLPEIAPPLKMWRTHKILWNNLFTLLWCRIFFPSAYR